MNIITEELIELFRLNLEEEEKSEATCKKYIHDVNAFQRWLNGREITKPIALLYKNDIKMKYKASSVNSIISSLNCFFSFCNLEECRLKSLKLQRNLFLSSEKLLNRREYERLLQAAKVRNKRLFYLLQTICSTGIRISELSFITVEAVQKKKAIIDCKGKLRVVILDKTLCKLLKEYIKSKNIKSGSIFIIKI